MAQFIGSNGYLSSSSQSPSPTGLVDDCTERQLRHTRAMSYVYKVKCTFDHQPDVYPYFISILKEFKSHTIDRSGVIRKVLPLFKDYPGLIEEFYTFLPPGWTVQHSAPVQLNTPMNHHQYLHQQQSVPVPQQQVQYNGNTAQVIQQNSQFQSNCPPIQQHQQIQYSNQTQYCAPMQYATPHQQQYSPMIIRNNN